MLGVIVLGLANLRLFGGWDLPRSLLVGIVIFLVIFPVMINTRFDELFSHFKEPRPVFCSLVLSTFPLESASLMILLLIVGYIIQVPTLAFFAQHYGKRLTAMPAFSASR